MLYYTTSAIWSTLFLGALLRCDNCIVVEEGQYYRWNSTNIPRMERVVFRVDRGQGYEEIARCYFQLFCGGGDRFYPGLASCYSNDSAYKASMSLNDASGTYGVILELMAVNRSMANWSMLWKDMDCRPNTSNPLNLTVYVKPESPACTEPEFDNSYRNTSILCYTERVYPAARCQFINYTPHVKLKPYLQHYYQQSSSDGNFKVMCEYVFRLPAINQRTTLVYAIRMSPVEGVEILTPNYTQVLALPSADTDVDCQEYIMSDIKNATCTCKLIDRGSPPGQAFWYSDGSNVVTVNKSDGSVQLLLSFNMSDTDPVFYCSSKSPIGKQSIPIVYKPKFLYAFGNVDLDISEPVEIDVCTPTQVHIMCHVSVQQLHTSTTAYFYIQDELSENFTSSNSISKHAFSGTFKTTSPGNFDIVCGLRNQSGYDIAKNQTTINVNNGVCNVEITTIVICVVLVVLVVLIVLSIVVIRRRRMYCFTSTSQDNNQLITHPETISNYATFDDDSCQPILERTDGDSSSYSSSLEDSVVNISGSYN